MRYLLILAFGAPVVSFLSWFMTPASPDNLFILNKTVATPAAQERASLFWILNHKQLELPNGERYDRQQDYFGFFPGADLTFTTRDIEDFSGARIDSLADTLDGAYFLDTYGVYANDYYGRETHPNQLIYGGLYKNDLDLLTALKDRGKLIITEFNILGESTPPNARKRFLQEFGLKWTGWSGRYFDSLDSLQGAGIPPWIFDLQRQQSGQAWPYKRSGIILVNANDDLIVLESGQQLLRKVPVIKTRALYAQEFNLPDSVNYISWFDIVYAADDQNELVATLQLPVTAAGDSLLLAHGLGSVFPAILAHVAEDYQFYYFAGDFSDNRVVPASAYFKGVHWLQILFYNPDNVLDRRAFFWQYYRPLVSAILERGLHSKK